MALLSKLNTKKDELNEKYQLSIGYYKDELEYLIKIMTNEYKGSGKDKNIPKIVVYSSDSGSEDQISRVSFHEDEE